MRLLRAVTCIPAVLFGACASFGSDTPERAPETTPDAAAPFEPFAVSLGAPRVELSSAGPTTVEVVLRRGGYGGALRLTATGLPAGASAPVVEIVPGAVQAKVPIAVDASVLPGTVQTSIVAHAVDGGREVVLPLELVVRGAPGALDVTFGTNGIARFRATDSRSVAAAVATDTKGRIYVGGYRLDGIKPERFPLLARLTSAGSLDAAFASMGFATSAQRGELSDIALDAQERVIAVGNVGAEPRGAVFRYTEGGVLDPAFSEGGTRTFDGENLTGAIGTLVSSTFSALVRRDSDELVVAVGSVVLNDDGLYMDPVAASFLPNQPSKGVILKGTTPISAAFDRAGDRVLATFGAGAGASIALAGLTVTALPVLESADHLAPLPLGGFLFSDAQGRLTRLDAALAVDNKLKALPSGCECRIVAIQSDGDYLAGGRAAGGVEQAALARVKASGERDSAFGSDGVTTSPLTAGYVVSDIAATTERKIVAVARPMDVTSGADFMVLRYWQ